TSGPPRGPIASQRNRTSPACTSNSSKLNPSGHVAVGRLGLAAGPARPAAIGMDQPVIGPGRRHRQQAPVDGGGFVAQREQRLLVAVRRAAHFRAQVVTELFGAHAAPPAASSARFTAVWSRATLYPLYCSGFAFSSATRPACAASPSSIFPPFIHPSPFPPPPPTPA